MSAERRDSTSCFCLITDSPLHSPNLVKNAIAGSEKFPHCYLQVSLGEKSHTDKTLKDVFIFVMEASKATHSQLIQLTCQSVEKIMMTVPNDKL